MFSYLRKTFFLFLFTLLLYYCTNDNQLKHLNDYKSLNFSEVLPVSMRVKLNKHQKVALSENRLMIAFRRKEQYVYLPVQALGKADDPYQYLLVDVFPVDFFEENATWHICETPEIFKVVAKMDSDSGQIVISEEDDIVLHYNYLQIFEKDVYRSELEKEQLKDLPGLESVRLKNQRYAVPRSNYIHPLFDLAGNLLTRDWPHDHPHHRGIYWAWPEVMYGNEMADLHALQDIYARPNGNFHFESGLLFAELIAENLWYWKDEKPLVKENACIRIHKKRNNYRIIDLELTFTPLLDSISIATRNQNSYGGLNIRLSEPQAQCIHYFMGEEQDLPLRAWSVLHGFFGGQTDESSGLIILQSRKNPDYPGAWVLYPELSWVQPTFPANDSRYILLLHQPLKLYYRIIIYQGEKPDVEFLNVAWDVYNLQ